MRKNKGRGGMAVLCPRVCCRLSPTLALLLLLLLPYPQDGGIQQHQWLSSSSSISDVRPSTSSSNENGVIPKPDFVLPSLGAILVNREQMNKEKTTQDTN